MRWRGSNAPVLTSHVRAASHRSEEEGFHMITLGQLQQAWGWAFPDSIDEIIKVSSFGNVLIRSGGKVWRITIEDCLVTELCDFCDVGALWSDTTFLNDWEMKSWVEAITKALGPLPEGKVIGFKTPRVLGGPDSVTNIYYATPSDYIGGFGEIARQIAKLPDGTEIKLRVAP